MKTGKKKKKRITFITITVIILIIAVVGVAYSILGPNSEKNKEFEKQNSIETEELTDKLVEEIEDIDTKAVKDDKDDAVEADISPALPAEDQKIIDQEAAKMDDAKKQQLLQTLAANYNSILNQQKAGAIAMIENLIAQGKAEWEAMVAAGENTPAAKGAKISEYLAMINTMEKNMDASVEKVLARMEQQMKDEGIEATPIIDKYRADYESIKAANRSIMLNKAKEALKK